MDPQTQATYDALVAFMATERAETPPDWNDIAQVIIYLDQLLQARVNVNSATTALSNLNTSINAWLATAV